MLLSSAKFEPSSADPEAVAIDVTQRVGLDLILPVASLLPPERRVQWSERMEISRKVLDTIADGGNTLAIVLVGGRVAIERGVARIPIVGPLVSGAAVSILVRAIEMTQAELKQRNNQAREDHGYLTATLTQFKLDLDQGVEGKLLIRSLK